jgi:transcriptional regulator with PAS, ATPase and Fis domain
VRIVAATNVNIQRAISEGKFREDLYYRLNQVPLMMPPLRERGEDIILLAEHFLATYAHKYNKVVKELNRDARQRLLRHTWPGNVRELMHAVERAVLLAKGSSLCAQDFVLKDSSRRTSQTQTLNLERLEQEAIERAMNIAGGNVTKAAELLGITRFALYRKLK